MPPGGYILLSRKFFESWLWTEEREFSRAEAFQDLVIGAAWAPYSRTVKGHVIAFERGEVLGSLRYLAERWGWSVKRVRVFVAQLEKKGTLRAQRETQAGQVYLLVNYDSYQAKGHSEGTARDEDRAQRGHSEGTARAQRKYSKDSEYNESKKTKEGAPAPPDASPPRPPVQGSPKTEAADAPIPEILCVPEFSIAWAARLDERSSKGSRYRPTEPQARAQLRQLARVAEVHGVAAAVECLEEATAAGWQGIVFKDRLPGANGKSNGKTNGYHPAGRPVIVAGIDRTMLGAAADPDEHERELQAMHERQQADARRMREQMVVS